STASDDSAQLARSASHHLARSLVFGVRRNAALRAKRPSTDARATTTDVDCQMKKAPIASRHDAPVPRRSSVIARTSPSPTITGTAATRKIVSLRNSSPPPVARLNAPASRNTKKTRPSRSPYHWMPPARYDQRWPLARGLAREQRPPVQAQDLDAAETPPVPLALERLERQRHDPVAPGLVHVQPVPAGPEQAQRQLGVLGDAPLVPPAELLQRDPPDEPHG